MSIQFKYYLAIEKSEVQICPASWVNLENMLSGKKDTIGHILGFHLYEVSRLGKSK